MRDPHEILGVTKAASEDEIKKVFRAKAKLYHPDLHPNDAAIAREFRDIVQAYQTCLKRRQEKDKAIAETGNSFSDELRRAAKGANPNVAKSATKPKKSAGSAFPEDKVDIGKKPRAPNPKAKPAASTASTTPEKAPAAVASGGVFQSLKDSIIGGFENMLKQSYAERKVAGAAPVSKKGAAKKEAKSATMADVHYTLDVEFLQTRNGAKKNLKLNDGRQVQVRVAPETRQDQVLRLKGMGMQSKNMPAGDALVTINITDDSFAERSNNDFFLRLPVTITEAALGGEIRIPGLYQDLLLNIPKGSNSGTNLRLKEKGFKDKATGEVGDQYVTLEIRLPNHLDKRLLSFLDAWSKDTDYDVRKNLGLSALDNTTKKENEK